MEGAAADAAEAPVAAVAVTLPVPEGTTAAQMAELLAHQARLCDTMNAASQQSSAPGVAAPQYAVQQVVYEAVTTSVEFGPWGSSPSAAADTDQKQQDAMPAQPTTADDDAYSRSSSSSGDAASVVDSADEHNEADDDDDAGVPGPVVDLEQQ